MFTVVYARMAEWIYRRCTGRPLCLDIEIEEAKLAHLMNEMLYNEMETAE